MPSAKVSNPVFARAFPAMSRAMEAGQQRLAPGRSSTSALAPEPASTTTLPASPV